MAKFVPIFKPNRDSVTLFENSYSIESSNKHPGSEDCKAKKNRKKIPTKICKSFIENY